MLQITLTDREYCGLISNSMILVEWSCALNPLPHLICSYYKQTCFDKYMINRPRS